MVRCQQCHREIFPGAKYCPACGWQVQPQCPTCGTVNPPGSHFCFSCGNRLLPEDAAIAPGGVAAVEATAPPGAMVCPRCYERNEPGSAYCFACGLPLDRLVGPGPAASRPIAAFALGQPGGFWVRLAAYVIDGVLLTMAFAVLWPIISGESIANYWESTEIFNAGDLFSVALNLAYYTGAVGIWATTAGKRSLGLFVVRTDGSKVGAGRALGRYLAYFLSVFTLGIGFIMVGLRPDKRGLHDLVCDTVVIRR